MNKKTILIGLGVLAVAGIGYYMWKKKSETKSGASGCGCGCEEKSNATSYTQAELDCMYNKMEAGSTMSEAKAACVTTKAEAVRKRNTNYSNAQAGGNKCDCFNGILTDSFGNVLKENGKNIECKCGAARVVTNKGAVSTS